MSDTYVVNVCTRVGPVDDKTHFSDCAVNHGRSSTLQLVCVDRQLSNIAMTDEFLGILSLWGIVEYRVGVDAVRSMFEFRMTQNIIRVIVEMLPDQWDDLSILVLKRSCFNNSSIRAFETRPRCIPSEIKLLHQALHRLPLVVRYLAVDSS